MSERLVYLVDDDEAIRRSAGFMLKTSGYQVKAFASGVELLKEAKELPAGCILLDVRMPEMDGWTVWERMKSHPELARIPVVILSADKDDGTRARTVGIHEFLRKPINRRSLVAAANRHCDRQRSAA